MSSSIINEFVMRGGQAMTAGKVNAFRQQLPFVQVKAQSFPPDEHPLLAERARFLARYVEDVLDGVYSSFDILAVNEAVFALSYMLKDVDIIPDTVPDGLSDDAAVLGSVLASHEDEFQAYAATIGFDFALIAVP